jgi:hypothetical protein
MSAPNPAPLRVLIGTDYLLNRFNPDGLNLNGSAVVEKCPVAETLRACRSKEADVIIVSWATACDNGLNLFANGWQQASAPAGMSEVLILARGDSPAALAIQPLIQASLQTRQRALRL